MSDEGFLEKLKEHLLNRYNREEIVKERGTCWFSVERNPRLKSPEETSLKWRISGSGTYPGIGEDFGGKVFVWSPTAGEVPDIIAFSFERDKLFLKRHVKYPDFEETREIWRLMVDRKNWKEIKKKSESLFEWLKKADGNAEEITRKTEMKVVFYIPSPEEGDRFHFVASFNPKGMSDEEKIKMIEKAIDAVEEARKGL
ncbi:MAG: hypothetical protein FGF51_07395 [Candidatus Brockarchaeota archaeon]|nr:hypothetical protein [Candidatus Brockarchaeota archaeon]